MSKRTLLMFAWVPPEMEPVPKVRRTRTMSPGTGNGSGGKMGYSIWMKTPQVLAACVADGVMIPLSNSNATIAVSHLSNWKVSMPCSLPP